MWQLTELGITDEGWWLDEYLTRTSWDWPWRMFGWLERRGLGCLHGAVQELQNDETLCKYTCIHVSAVSRLEDLKSLECLIKIYSGVDLKRDWSSRAWESDWIGLVFLTIYWVHGFDEQVTKGRKMWEKLQHNSWKCENTYRLLDSNSSTENASCFQMNVMKIEMQVNKLESFEHGFRNMNLNENNLNRTFVSWSEKLATSRLTIWLFQTGDAHSRLPASWLYMSFETDFRFREPVGR